MVADKVPTTEEAGRLTSAPGDARVPMPPRIHRILASSPPNVPSAAELIPNARRTPLEQPCLNPRCQTGRTCSWPERGRPASFCGMSCRVAYERERLELLQDIAALEKCLQSDQGTYRERRAVASELAKLKWNFRRYVFNPSEDE